jgi:hypothetical protein
VLHVVWHRPVSASSDDLMQTAISRTGGVAGGPVTIESGWQGLNAQPDLVVAPGGTSLRVFFAGTHTLTLNDPLIYQLLTATAGADGSSWSAPQRVTSSSHPSYASAGIGAAMAPNGTAVVAEGDPGNIFQFGIGGPDYVYESRAGMNVYNPGIGVAALKRRVRAASVGRRRPGQEDRAAAEQDERRPRPLRRRLADGRTGNERRQRCRRTGTRGSSVGRTFRRSMRCGRTRLRRASGPGSPSTGRLARLASSAYSARDRSALSI